jgi:flagellar motor protein MotB
MGRESDKKQEEGAPGWMLTLGDITMLLLTFFVLLVSLMSLEKPRYVRFEGFLQGLNAETGRAIPEGTPDQIEEMRHRIEEAVSGQRGTVEHRIEFAKNLYAVVSPEGNPRSPKVVFTIGGSHGAFGEGRWEIEPQVYLFLQAIRAWGAGAGTEVLVRAHTDSHPADTARMTPEGTIVSSAGANDPAGAAAADYRFLALLRAIEVARYLSAELDRGGKDIRPLEPIRPDQIRIEAVGPFEPASSEPRSPANRRVEIVMRRRSE